MRVAYADPPYLGASRKHYGDHPEHAVYDTVDGHRQLIERLVAEFPDGWALSMASKNLWHLLPFCPEDVRVMAWVKPFTTFFPNVPVAWAWEPVIVRGGRKRSKDEPTVRDYVVANSPAVRGKGFTGRKPPEFCWWLFEVLGMTPDDELVDLFPGSGSVTEAWGAWRGQLRWFGPEVAVLGRLIDEKRGEKVLRMRAEIEGSNPAMWVRGDTEGETT